MAFIKIRITSRLVRVAYVFALFGAAFCYYQFIYKPYDQAIQKNLTLANEAMEKVARHEEIQSRYKVLSNRFRSVLNQKGIEERERWLLQSGEELVNKLDICFKSHSVEPQECVEVDFKDSEGSDGIEYVRTVFKCDLKKLFLVLSEIDHFPPNVSVLKLELDESGGPEHCQVRFDFAVDIDHLGEEQASEEKALSP